MRRRFRWGDLPVDTFSGEAKRKDEPSSGQNNDRDRAVDRIGMQPGQRGPILAGGREVKSWIVDLRDPDPQVRRKAVLKLGNVGDSDPAAAVGLAEALHDSDPTVRRNAVSAVAKLRKPNEEIMACLRIMIDRDGDARVRDYAKCGAIVHFEKVD